jgi:hypothetical protein
MPTKNPFKKVAQKMADVRARHRERHRVSGFGFSFADRISYLPETHWDQATETAGFFMSRPYLQILEKTGGDKLRQRYALVYEGDSPIAAVCTQMGEISAAQFSKKPSGAKSGKISKLFRPMLNSARSVKGKSFNRIRARFLICGNLLSWGPHGVSFAPRVEAAKVWPAIAEALYRIRRSEKLLGQTDLVMLKDFPGPELESTKPLRRYSYRSANTGPNMILEFCPEVKCFDDYLGLLNTRYRKASKQVIKEIDSSGCRVERLTDFKSHAASLYQLYMQVHERAKTRPFTLSPDYLPLLSEVAGDHLRCTVIRKEDEILAFVTTLKDGQTAVGYFLGLNYSYQAELPLYFRLLLAAVQDAIELGCRRLSLGRTALEPKARLGAKPEELHVWLRHRIPALNWMLRNLLGMVPHEAVPERHVFKSTSQEGDGGSSNQVTEA